MIEVEIPSGRLLGRRLDGVVAFAGIPYARAPRRWAAAERVERWTGVREAVAFGPVAPQTPPIPGVGFPGDPEEQSEDCLSLNVWTPDADDGTRPVMVWIHGGGFTTGTGAGLLYRGGDLARRGNVVVVTLNYRLGALGFLAHPALADPDTGTVGNWGLQDQVAALRWVRDSIGAFGGDPGSVTIFGESAGAMSISALLAAPSARGLFHRAVIESGPIYCHSMDRAERAGEDLAGLLDIAQVTRHALESVPAGALVEATAKMQSRLPDPGEIPLPFLPVTDGTFLPDDPLAAIAGGSSVGIPLVIGTNKDELTFFALGDRRMQTLDEPGLLQWIERAAPDSSAREVVEVYTAALSARGLPTTPRDIWVAAGSDLVFRWPSQQLADAHRIGGSPTFVYLFTWETPAFGGLLGSCHALEIPFVFGGVRRPVIANFTGGGPKAEALSGAMQGAWLAFAHAGNPSTPDIGGWPVWDPASAPTMIFGADSHLAHGPGAEELAVWRARTATLLGT